MNHNIDLDGKNLKVFSKADEFETLLQSFGVIERGYFEYKGKVEDGRRKRGEYFVNYRLLSTPQELQLVPYYEEAIEEFLGDRVKDMVVVGVAYGSLSLPKIIQTLSFDKFGMEYTYAEKRNGVLGLFDEQAQKCKGKHLLFIEDVCNNATSCGQLSDTVNDIKNELGIKGYSIIYGVHRGHTFPDEPKGEIYAMTVIDAPAYHPDEIPEHLKDVPLKEYKK